MVEDTAGNNITRLGNNDAHKDDRHTDRELPGIADALIVGTGGLGSIAIATLGVWKFVELVIL
jgi:hypothetical protein